MKTNADATLNISSHLVGDEFRVTVITGDPGAPALYVLDPIFLFDLAVGAASLLQTAARLTGGHFPTLTIVGIGYPSDEPGNILKLRARDFTPTDGRHTTAVQLPELPFGGAGRFLAALEEEIVPTVESQFQVDSLRRGIAGFSFGGLFAFYALFHRPRLFSRYLIGSPSLWWDNGIAFIWEDQWAGENRDLAARIFLSVGMNEQLVGNSWKNEGYPLEILQRAKMVDNMKHMAARLRERGYKQLNLESAVFEDEYHLTVPPVFLTRGLLVAYEG